jgi:hypothetical protein
MACTFAAIMQWPSKTSVIHQVLIAAEGVAVVEALPHQQVMYAYAVPLRLQRW